MPDFDIIAIDLDGTLLDSSHAPTPDNVRAVRRAAELGVRIVVSTARPPRATVDITRALDLHASPAHPDEHGLITINYNGALTWDWERSEHIDHRPLLAQTAREVAAAGRALDPDVFVFVEIIDRWLTDRWDPALLPMSGINAKPHEVGPIESFLADPITKLMLLAPPERLAPVREMVADRFIAAGSAGLTITDAHLIQVHAPGVSKGAALESLAARLGVDRSRVMAIGDGTNDADMLRWAGTGLAVANACEEAIAAADETLDRTNDDSAVALAIERALGV